jgi:hypothetical protein
MAGAGAGQQAAMLAAQSGAFGAEGLAHTLGSFGVNPMLGKAATMATMGPQGFLGSMSGKDMMQMGSRIPGLFNQQEQPPMAPAPMPAPPQNRPPMPLQPVSMFRTSPLKRRM